MSPLLEIRNLRIAGSGGGLGKPVPIVDDVSLVLHGGEVLGLIGESGAGKSTIGFAALGHVRAGCAVVSGQVLFGGSDLLRMPDGELRRLRGRRIAYVAQSAAASFNPAWTIGAQVAEGPVLHGVASTADAHREAIRLFRELDLPSPETFGRRYPHQVSGGQLQRAMVAMAMSCRPDILVFDEPTTALDVTTQIEVLAAIRALVRDHGTAALYISHDLAVVAQLADRIMVLRDGKMVEAGARDTILRNPSQPYTRALLSVRAADTSAALLAPKPHDPEPLLSLSGVSAGYRARSRAVDDVSLVVHPGEVVAVVGESGSGKTTLARVICGLLPPRDGELRFAGKPLARTSGGRGRADLRRIQLVHQMPDTALNPSHRVGLIIARPLRVFGRLREPALTHRVEALLAMVELPRDIAARRPTQLSGGEKQRVCIARALAAEPTLMVCDEVTSALDPIVADGIIRLLRRLREELNLSLLFISHDLGAVRRVADQVLVMLRGRVVDQGSVADVLSPPRHAYTRTLLASVPELRAGWLDEFLATRALAMPPASPATVGSGPGHPS